MSNFEFNPKGSVIVVPAILRNNRLSFYSKMVLDTGATYTMISWEIAEHLGFKFVAERKADGSIGPMAIATRDWSKNRMYPQHSAIAEVAGLDPINCIGGAAKLQEGGKWLLSKLLATTVGPVSPEQFEEAVRASNEQGYTIVSI